MACAANRGSRRTPRKEEEGMELEVARIDPLRADPRYLVHRGGERLSWPAVFIMWAT
jgi:hypothetical protein